MSKSGQNSERIGAFKKYHIQQDDITLTLEYPQGWQAGIVDNPGQVPKPPCIEVVFCDPMSSDHVKVDVHRLEESMNGNALVAQWVEDILEQVARADSDRKRLADMTERAFRENSLPEHSDESTTVVQRQLLAYQKLSQSSGLIESRELRLPCGKGWRVTRADTVGPARHVPPNMSPEEFREAYTKLPERFFSSKAFIPGGQYVYVFSFRVLEAHYARCRTIFEHMLATFRFDEHAG